MVPLVPVTESVEFPDTALAAAERVRVLLPLPDAMLAGENFAVTPEGRPVAESATADLKPLTGEMVNVTVTEPPGARLTLEEFFVSVNPG